MLLHFPDVEKRSTSQLSHVTPTILLLLLLDELQRLLELLPGFPVIPVQPVSTPVNRSTKSDMGLLPLWTT